MNLSKEMALRLHRMMWSDMQKELGDNPSPDARNKFKSEWIQRMFPDEYIRNHCFLCEYAKAGCSECPIDWGNPYVSKWPTLCFGDNSNYASSPISVILALPEKGKEEMKAGAVAIESDKYKYKYHYLKIKQALASNSGLPEWIPAGEHIDAIKKKAVDDYFKDNPGSKLVTMDVDAAFKQYAREQKAPILRRLANRSGLNTSEPVEMHLDMIEENAAVRGKDAERGRTKIWLSEFSGLPEEKEFHEHMSAIIDNNYDKGRKDLLEEMRKRVEG